MFKTFQELITILLTGETGSLSWRHSESELSRKAKSSFIAAKTLVYPSKEHVFSVFKTNVENVYLKYFIKYQLCF